MIFQVQKKRFEDSPEPFSGENKRLTRVYPKVRQKRRDFPEVNVPESINGGESSFAVAAFSIRNRAD